MLFRDICTVLAILLLGMPTTGDAKCFDKYALCAGNGQCKDGQCICDAGWNGKDVIIDLSGTHPDLGSNCQVSLDLQVYFCGINMITCPLAMFVSLFRAITLYYGRKKKFDNMVLLCLIGSASQAIQLFNFTCVSMFDLHIFDSIALCLGFCLWGGTYWPAVFMYIYMMLPITAMSKAEGVEMQKKFKPLLLLNTFIGAVGFIVPFLLAYIVPSLGQVWAMFCYLTMALTTAGMGLIFFKVLGRIASAVKPEPGSNPNPENVKRYKKYTMIRRGCVFFCAGCSVIFALIALLDWTRIRGGHLFFNICALSASLCWIAMMMVFKAPKSELLERLKGSILGGSAMKMMGSLGSQVGGSKNKVAPSTPRGGKAAASVAPKNGPEKT